MTAPRSRGESRSTRIAAGFTLLELLVALAVFGVVLVSLAQGTRFSLLTLSANSRMAGGKDDLEIADGVVRHLIEGMDPGAGLDPVSMSGGGDWLECVTTLPDASDAMPDRRMSAELRVDSRHRLVLRWRPWLRAARLGPETAPSEAELLRGVSGISIYYWGPGGNWVTAWHDAELPALVRVRLRFPDGDPRHWPDIIAAPGLDRQ